MSEQPAAALTTIAEVAAELGELGVRDEAVALNERAAEGRFYVACIGQFKRGKSTLLDALIGEALLPVGVVPVTAVPTIIRHGPRGARIRETHGWRPIDIRDLAEYVDESRNPGNAKAVQAVEVFVEVPLLAGGLCLVDTPGVGSVHEANTTAAIGFVPQIDAAIVLLGADPPLAAEELSLIELTARRTPVLMFVMSKADRMQLEERVESAEFARRIIAERLEVNVGTVYHVSAKAHLDGVPVEDDWAALVGALSDLSKSSKHALLRSATEHGSIRLRDRLLTRVALERRMLRAPVEEREGLIGELTALESHARILLDDLRALIAEDERRIVAAMTARRAAFLSRSDDLVAEFNRQFDRFAERGGRLRRKAFELAQELAREAVMPWLDGEKVFAETAYGHSIDRFRSVVSALASRLQRAGVARVHWEQSGEDLSARSTFHFHSFERLADDAAPTRLIVDMLRGVTGAREGVRREAIEFLNRLLDTNSSRVEFDLRDRLRRSREAFEVSVLGVVRAVATSARESHDRAQRARNEGSPAVESALLRLDQLSNRLNPA